MTQVHVTHSISTSDKFKYVSLNLIHPSSPSLSPSTPPHPSSPDPTYRMLGLYSGRQRRRRGRRRRRSAGRVDAGEGGEAALRVGSAVRRRRRLPERVDGRAGGGRGAEFRQPGHLLRHRQHAVMLHRQDHPDHVCTARHTTPVSEQRSGVVVINMQIVSVTEMTCNLFHKMYLPNEERANYSKCHEI